MSAIVTLIAMTEAEYAAWLSDAVPAYAAYKAASGQWSETESLGLARQLLDSVLPRGLQTPDDYLFIIRGDSTLSLGVLWIAAKLGFIVTNINMFKSLTPASRP